MRPFSPEAISVLDQGRKLAGLQWPAASVTRAGGDSVMSSLRELRRRPRPVPYTGRGFTPVRGGKTGMSTSDVSFPGEV